MVRFTSSDPAAVLPDGYSYAVADDGSPANWQLPTVSFSTRLRAPRMT